MTTSTELFRVYVSTDNECVNRVYVGAVVGGMIMRFLGFSTPGGLIPTLLVAILGGVVVVALVRMLKRV